MQLGREWQNDACDHMTVLYYLEKFHVLVNEDPDLAKNYFAVLTKPFRGHTP